MPTEIDRLCREKALENAVRGCVVADEFGGSEVLPEMGQSS